jgi:hypothetical protein
VSGNRPDDPPRGPGAERRSDLGVEVTRELGGGGRLARGSRTGYSTLGFSARGVPAAELPPPGQDADEAVSDAEGDAVRTGAGRTQGGASVTPSVADPAPARARAEPGLLGRMAKLLGLRGKGP